MGTTSTARERWPHILADTRTSLDDVSRSWGQEYLANVQPADFDFAPQPAGLGDEVDYFDQFIDPWELVEQDATDMGARDTAHLVPAPAGAEVRA